MKHHGDKVGWDHLRVLIKKQTNKIQTRRIQNKGSGLLHLLRRLLAGRRAHQRPLQDLSDCYRQTHCSTWLQRSGEFFICDTKIYCQYMMRQMVRLNVEFEETLETRYLPQPQQQVCLFLVLLSACLFVCMKANRQKGHKDKYPDFWMCEPIQF